MSVPRPKRRGSRPSLLVRSCSPLRGQRCDHPLLALHVLPFRPCAYYVVRLSAAAVADKNGERIRSTRRTRRGSRKSWTSPTGSGLLSKRFVALKHQCRRCRCFLLPSDGCECILINTCHKCCRCSHCLTGLVILFFALVNPFPSRPKLCV